APKTTKNQRQRSLTAHHGQSSMVRLSFHVLLCYALPMIRCLWVLVLAAVAACSDLRQSLPDPAAANPDAGPGSSGSGGRPAEQGTDGPGAVVDLPVADDSMGAPCSNACTAGSSKCNGIEVQSCILAANGCTVWTSPMACPAPQACNIDRCQCPVASCPSLGAKSCGPSGGVRECRSEGACRVWSDESACAIPNGTGQCMDGVCSPAACATGYHRCETTCRSNLDANACGDTCQKCPGVANASPVCDGGQCSFKCDSKFARCAEKPACERMAWDFEDGETNGFTVEAGQALPVLHNRSYAGRYALSAISLGFNYIYKWFDCGAPGISLKGKTISAWVYLDSATNPANGVQCALVMGGLEQTQHENTPYEQWFQLKHKVSDAEGGNVRMFWVACSNLGADNLALRVTIDNVAIE
ncbi:MAG TPA: hypothetical protein VGF45_13720, partial [Polyangia bacterium]